MIFLLFLVVHSVVAGEDANCTGSDRLPSSDCTKYWEHHAGRAYLYDCPEGLLFDKERGVCDVPETVECPESRECPRGHVVCPDVDEKYYALPNCSHFCQCSNGRSYLHSCPEGLHFNSVLNACDWPQNADCSEDKDSDSTIRTTTTTRNVTPNDVHSSNVCIRAGVACPEVDGEHSLYSALPNCSQFCQCSNGRPHLHNCPVGLHFNPTLNVCDWPQAAGCSREDGTDKETSDLPKNEATTSRNEEDVTSRDHEESNICTEVGVVCPEVDGEHPLYSALPNCSQFCQCSNGRPHLHNCPVGLHFNPTLNVCDWPQNAGCAEEESVCAREGIVCPEVDGVFPEYYPTSNCSQFCQCSNGKPYLHTCGGGLHFNPSLNVCDWPELAGCQDPIPSR